MGNCLPYLVKAIIDNECDLGLKIDTNIGWNQLIPLLKK